jgi:hypothetical protein
MFGKKKKQLKKKNKRFLVVFKDYGHAERFYKSLKF